MRRYRDYLTSSLPISCLSQIQLPAYPASQRARRGLGNTWQAVFALACADVGEVAGKEIKGAIMISFSIYKYEEPELKEFTENSLFDMEFKLSHKGDYETFRLYEVKMKKDIVDSIYIQVDDSVQEIKSYYKIYYLDIFLIDQYLIVKGSYEARALFAQYVQKSQNIKVETCSTKLEELINIFSELQSLSIKDFSAKINKLKATGRLETEDDDIQTFLERGGEITAITIQYPCGKEFVNVHIKNDCSLRINDCEELGSLEDIANFIKQLLEHIIV